MNTKLGAIPEFKGIVTDKKWKNQVFLFLFPVLLIPTIILISLSAQNFNKDILFHPSDFRGDFCGTMELE